MVVAAFDPGIRKPDVTWDAGANSDWPRRFHQAPGLLDVQVEVCAEGGRVEMADAGAQCLRGAPTVGDVIGQGAAGIDAADVECAIGQSTQAPTAADIGYLEPD